MAILCIIVTIFKIRDQINGKTLGELNIHELLENRDKTFQKWGSQDCIRS